MLDSAAQFQRRFPLFAWDAKRLACRSLFSDGFVAEAIVEATDLAENPLNEREGIYVQMDVELMSMYEAGNVDAFRNHAPRIQELENSLEDAIKRDKRMRELGALPEKFRIHPAFPNPFNSTANLSYKLSDNVRITLAVYDIDGRRVTILQQGMQPAGVHRLTWDAGSVPSSSYFIRLDTPGNSMTSKVTLVR